jgi:uncharacterized membrane protein
MTSLTKTRIESIDLLKGLVMVIMALDHTRDYFHASAFIYNPTDPVLTSLPIFFTRWITHFCAPVFFFLAGISAFFVGKKKVTSELSEFLIKRGLWLVFIEMTIVNFAWYFDIQFRTPGLLVIWSLGISMLVLAALVHLPRNVIFILSDSYKLYVDYPIIPWIAVMSLGYCFGELYNQSFDSYKRKRILNIIGVSAIVLFLILRGSNIYGDPIKWVQFNTLSKTLMSIMATSKYPPSLSFLLMTLGPAFIFLANTENLKGRVVSFFGTFGRVPFFYYILHLYLIHTIAMIVAQVSGFGWNNMILTDWVTAIPTLKGYGFGLWFVYLMWVVVIVLLYPLCKKFDNYKMNHKKKWWLSYL